MTPTIKADLKANSIGKQANSGMAASAKHYGKFHQKSFRNELISQRWMDGNNATYVQPVQ